MKNSDKFCKWWLEEGSSIENSFDLAKAAWEEGQKGLGVKLTPSVTYGEAVVGTRQTLVDGNYYTRVPEIDSDSCDGCVAEKDNGLCNKLGDSCIFGNMIWLKVER